MRALTGSDSLMKVAENAGSFGCMERNGHPGEEVVYVIEGQLEIELDGETFLLGAGDVLNFDSSLAHTYQAVGDAQPRVLVITADPSQHASPIDGSGTGSYSPGGTSGGSTSGTGVSPRLRLELTAEHDEPDRGSDDQEQRRPEHLDREDPDDRRPSPRRTPPRRVSASLQERGDRERAAARPEPGPMSQAPIATRTPMRARPSRSRRAAA